MQVLVVMHDRKIRQPMYSTQAGGVGSAEPEASARGPDT